MRRSADRVCSFLSDCAPAAYGDLGPEPAGDSFATRTLPLFFDVADEDRRALEEMSSSLAAFADRRFPKNDELASLKSETSPVPLLKGILKLLAQQKSGAR